MTAAAAVPLDGVPSRIRPLVRRMLERQDEPAVRRAIEAVEAAAGNARYQATRAQDDRETLAALANIDDGITRGLRGGPFLPVELRPALEAAQAKVRAAAQRVAQRPPTPPGRPRLECPGVAADRHELVQLFRDCGFTKREAETLVTFLGQKPD